MSVPDDQSREFIRRLREELEQADIPERGPRGSPQNFERVQQVSELMQTVFHEVWGDDDR